MASPTRAQLLGRKHDLYAALRVLEQDHADGTVDDMAYRAARQRYEHEAAQVLAQLDRLHQQDAQPMRLPRDRRPLLLGGAVAAALAVIAVGLFLGSSLAAKQQTTGALATPVPTSREVAAALQHVRRAPRSVDARLALGNAYLDAGQGAQADASYRAAMKLDAARPEPPTLHAMMLGFAGRRTTAIALLRQVERAHPTFARAWLLDGIFANAQHLYRAAVGAWRHFLRLAPNSSFAPRIRVWIAGAEKAARRA